MENDPVATESVSKVVSEPGAVAMGSNNFRETWWSGRYRSRFWHGLL